MTVPHDTLIIGIGNRYRGDDGVGFYVICNLQDCDLQNVELMEVKPDGYSLIEVWKDRELVIIVDAAVGTGPPGTIKRFDALKEKIPSMLSPVSSHSISLAETISLAKSLKQLPKRLYIFAIEIGKVNYGTSISPVVREAGKRVAQKIISLVESEYTEIDKMNSS